MSSQEDLRAAFLAGHDRGSRYNEGWAEQNREKDWLAWSQTLEPATPAAAGLPVVRHVLEPAEHDGTHVGTLAQIESLIYRAKLAVPDDVDMAAVQVRVHADAAGRIRRIDVIW